MNDVRERNRIQKNPILKARRRAGKDIGLHPKTPPPTTGKVLNVKRLFASGQLPPSVRTTPFGAAQASMTVSHKTYIPEWNKYYDDS
jgi:hypothetical protein